METTLLHLLGRQFMVASRAQMIDLGLSSHTISRLCIRGQLEPVMSGVFRLAGSPVSVESQSMALLVKAQGAGVLAETTSAFAWNVPYLRRGRLQMMVPFGMKLRAPDWAQIIRSRWPDEDRVDRADGLIVTSPERTLFGLGAVVGWRRFEYVAEHMWNRHLIDPAALRVWLQSHRGRGRTGVKRMEAWLESVEGRTLPSQSRGEIDLIEACREAGMPEPLRQYPLVIEGGRRTIHLDAAWPRVQLGIEPGHTIFHTGDAGRRDRQRDKACDEIGWRVIRFDEFELRDLATCAVEVRRHYDRRLAFFRSVPSS